MAGRTKLFDVLAKNRFFSSNLVNRYQSTLAVEELSKGAASIQDEYASAIPFSQMPTPKGLPLLGNMLEFTKKENMINSIAYHKGLTKELGPIYKIRLPNMDIVCITSAEDSQKLYNNDGRYPTIASFELFERVRKNELAHIYPTAGLLSSGEEWHSARALVQQDLMRPKSALFYIDDLSELMDHFIAKVESLLDDDRKIKDLARPLHEFALDAIGIMFIGSKLHVLQGSEYGKLVIDKVIKAFEMFLTVQGLPKSIAPYIPQYKEFVKITEEVYLMSKEKIFEAIKKHEVDGSLEGTVLEKMIERCGKDSPLPVVMANDALFAGIDTTGNTAAFILYHLATNPHKQEILYQEILKVVGSDGKMTEEALAEMRYLKACQQESARIAPVALGTARSAGQDMVLSGHQIPKGTFVIRMGVLMSNDERYFNNPEQFMPERWMRGCPQHQKPKNPHANIPFGHGPRACVGQRFAKLELYMAVFKVIQKYKISYDGPALGIDYLGLGSLTGPLNLKFEKRV